MKKYESLENYFKEGSDLKECLELQRKLLSQEKKARNKRLRFINELHKSLKNAYYNNQQIEETDEYNKIICDYETKKRKISTIDRELYLEKEKQIEEELTKSLEAIGYVRDYRLKDLITINQYINKLYDKYVCSIFGHQISEFLGNDKFDSFEYCSVCNREIKRSEVIKINSLKGRQKIIYRNLR